LQFLFLSSNKKNATLRNLKQNKRPHFLSSVENKHIFYVFTMSSSLGSGLGTADIVGIAVGGLLALVTVIGIAISCYALCCQKKPPARVAPYPPPYNQPNPYGQQMNTGYYPQQYYPQQGQYWGPPPPNYVEQQPYYPAKPAY
jgi:hypothetical protein